LTAYSTPSKEERLSVISDILDLSKRGIDPRALPQQLHVDGGDLASLLLLLKDANAIVEEKQSLLHITATGESLLEEVEQREKYQEGLRVGQVSAYYGDYPSGSGLFATELVNQLLLRTNYSIEVFSSDLGEGDRSGESNQWLRVHRGATPGLLWNVNPVSFVLPQMLLSDLDIVHIHSYLYLTSIQAALTKRAKGTKTILHLHGGVDGRAMLGTDDRRKIIFKERIFDRTLGQFVADSADLVLSSSRKDLLLAQEKWHIPAEKTELVPPAVDTNTFRPNGFTGAIKNLVFLGRLESWKGFQLLLDAVQLVVNEAPEVQLLVAGSGSQMKEFSAIAAKKRLPIIFLGKVPHARVPKLLQNAYATVMPSHIEGLPLACLESMATGVPVIASDVGDFREVVTDGETGLLVDSLNHERLASAILALLEDEPLRKKMGVRARDLMVSKYSWNVVFSRIMKAYKRTLDTAAA
jgi:glycosyltransferase involved in cell wall biosynthesis